MIKSKRYYCLHCGSVLDEKVLPAENVDSFQLPYDAMTGKKRYLRVHSCPNFDKNNPAPHTRVVVGGGDILRDK